MKMSPVNLLAIILCIVMFLLAVGVLVVGRIAIARLEAQAKRYCYTANVLMRELQDQRAITIYYACENRRLWLEKGEAPGRGVN